MFLLLSKNKILVYLFLTHITDISSLVRAVSELVGANDIDDKVWKDKVLPAKSTNKKKLLCIFWVFFLVTFCWVFWGKKSTTEKEEF